MAGEIEDARAALEWLRERYSRICRSRWLDSPSGRASSASSAVPSRARSSCWPRDSRRASGSTAYLDTCAIPKIFIQSTHDQFAPRLDLEEMYQGFAAPKELHWIESPDHFFAGALDALEEQVFRAAEGY